MVDARARAADQVSDTPRILFEGDDWRIVRVELPPPRREGPDDKGVRDLIEVRDGKDLMEHPRWKQLDTKVEGVSTYSRICHALKRELLNRIDHAE